MSDAPTLVVFSSHTHILPFTEAEVCVGEVLRESGWRIVFLTAHKCTCCLPHSFVNEGLKERPECRKCLAEIRILRTTLRGWECATLSDFAQPDDWLIAENCLKDLDPSNLKDLTFRGIEVGQAAIHDVTLKCKIDDLDFRSRPEVWKDYLAVLRGCILATIRMDRVHERFLPSALSTYNSNYSLNRVVSLDCERRGIPAFSMHGGASLRYVWDTLMLTKGDIETYRQACVNNWTRSMHSRCLNAEETGRVGEHFRELFVGKKAHAYSAAAGSASPGKLFADSGSKMSLHRTILLCLSSSDERFAVEESGIRPVFPPEKFVFPQQYDLLGFLIDKVSREEGMRLVIRVHPRDFPNKRDPGTSDNGRRLKGLLQNLPDNVVVNWPEDKISYYDLLQHVDLVVTAWSTVLLEASIFGCPIVLPFNPTRYYDACADAVCHDRDSYWAAIIDHVARPWTLTRSIRSFRWYWMVQFGGAISLESQDRRASSAHEWMLRGFDWFSKTTFMGNPPYWVPSKAFSGSFKRLLQRRINPRGAAAIAATLKGEIDPMEDFRELQRLQGLRDGFVGGLEAEQDEARAVLWQLSEFAKMLKLDPQNCPESKFLAMLEREHRAGNIHPVEGGSL